jgi:hypothetical protein
LTLVGGSNVVGGPEFGRNLRASRKENDSEELDPVPSEVQLLFEDIFAMPGSGCVGFDIDGEGC